MSVFTQQLNPISGKLEWEIQDENYDYKQELARSAYADMLHDYERNDKYYEGLRRSINDLRQRGQPVHVLDIGTGTGLLSMMALECGADSVTACEAFKPMAECALKVLSANGYADKVRLISKRSTELEVGPGKDLVTRANLLVTEVFDTELIGEGALESYRHAMSNLMTEDALLVPSEATIYAQVVCSPLLRQWNRLQPIKGVADETLFAVPPSVAACAGAAAVHDLQLSQLSQDSFIPLSEPIPVFSFDWSGRNRSLSFKEEEKSSFRALASGNCDAVFMWWDLKMDQSGDVMLSCAPYWAHPDLKDVITKNSEGIPWRDHWMQAVYYLPNEHQVEIGSELTLRSAHDEYSLWFDIHGHESAELASERPICECGVHVLCSRTRIGQMNDFRRRDIYTNALKRHVDNNTVCLFLGEFSPYAIVAAKLGARHVYIVECKEFNKRIWNEWIQHNALHDRVTILKPDLEGVCLDQLIAPITLVFSEPSFTTSILPWHSLNCWYLTRSAAHLLSPGAVILPSKCSIWCLPVQYRDLWKIRAPLGTCNGFSLDIFDKMIDKACNEADEMVEPHPLWEYPAKALVAHAVPLISLEMLGELPQVSVDHGGSITVPGTVNGLALWADWHFGDEEREVVSTGPVETVVLNENVKWDVHTRQGVHLFNKFEQSYSSGENKLVYSTTFKPADGQITFHFNIDD